MKYDPTKVWVASGNDSTELVSVSVPICVERLKSRELDIELNLPLVGIIKGRVVLDEESVELFDAYLKNKE